MKMAPIRNPAVDGATPPQSAAAYVASSVKANLKRLSLPAPRNCVQKRGAKRRSRSNRNWLEAMSGALPDVFEHRVQRLLEEWLVDPVEDFLADLFRGEDARLAQQL